MTTLATVDEQAAALLECAAGYVESGWTQHANARNQAGTPCTPESPYATCWCAHGGLFVASHKLGCWTHTNGCIDDTTWNDEQWHDHARIIGRARSALLEAIEQTADAKWAEVLEAAGIATWNDDGGASSGAEVGQYMRRASCALREAA